jgi:hypothetical protein
VPSTPPSRCQVLAEIVLIFAVFAIQGAWPVPDVNEPYYLGKAIHFWNPDWLPHDFFMDSPDTHKVFYFTFGWLSLWLPKTVLAWSGRALSWALLAWAWRRLSFAVVPKAWWSVLTAAMFACLMERCQMAGEWVIGGVEAKPFAYAFVFLGIEALLRDRWNRALALFGAAAAFHVLVGGWAAVAAGVAWWLGGRGQGAVGSGQSAVGSGQSAVASRQSAVENPPSALRPPPSANPQIPKSPNPQIPASLNLQISKSPNPSLWSLWLGILGGLLLASPGIIPAVALDWGVDRGTAQKAHEIYVFERLPHHLTLSGIQPELIVRLALLWIFWLLLGRWSRRAGLLDDCRQPLGRLRAFVSGAVAITLAGAAVNLLMFVDRGLAADLLRYYWYRLTDVMIPLGVAVEMAALIVGRLTPASQQSSDNLKSSRELTAPGEPVKRLRGLLAPGYCLLLLAAIPAAWNVGDHALQRLHPGAPRSHRIPSFADWRAACRWVVDSGEVPADAKFLLPRDAQTFKWYTGRSDVATWKDVPQGAKSLLEWWRRIQDIYATDFPEGPRWYEPLTDVGTKRIRELGAKYHADYLLSERVPPPLRDNTGWSEIVLGLDAVYKNKTYIIYRIR